METTKFKELCMAFGRAQNQFQNYKNDCHNFAVEMVNELKIYFQIPESQFSLYHIDGQNEFSLVQPELINAISLRPDSMWQFGIGLTVCSAPETLPKELILIPILIRRDLDANYFLRYGEQEQEFKIEKPEKYNFIPFFDYLHQTIVRSYDEELAHFIGQDTRRTIGYNK